MIVKGKENIPLDGPLIVASNHIAFSDPAIIVANCPRTVHFMAKSELFDNPFKSAFMRNMNAFPVKRNHFDRTSLRYAMEILKNGWILGIFPEGRRVRKTSPTEPKNGIAYLAKITGADILPTCIYRSPDDDAAWHNLVLVYGKVIKNSELDFNGDSKSEKLVKASEMIMKRINELWEHENESKSG
ncbi:MAG: 1-acyl-sn-glycerol-3-phosphate acyltransferase [Clostridia bacterium]|nr:1-acyl-sn-glycerol-3-phosphate acyltransferase [Clostridia bacterium]